MPDLRFLSSRHDGSRPQRAGVVPPRPEAIALARAMEKNHYPAEWFEFIA